MASVTGQLLVVLRHADVIVDTCRTRVYTHAHAHAQQCSTAVEYKHPHDKQAYVACVFVVVASVMSGSKLVQKHLNQFCSNLQKNLFSPIFSNE